MTKTLTTLIAALAVSATMAAGTAQAAGENTRGFLSSGHTTGSNLTAPIAGGDLGSGRVVEPSTTTSRTNGVSGTDLGSGR